MAAFSCKFLGAHEPSISSTATRSSATFSAMASGRRSRISCFAPASRESWYAVDVDAESIIPMYSSTTMMRMKNHRNTKALAPKVCVIG